MNKEEKKRILAELDDLPEELYDKLLLHLAEHTTEELVKLKRALRDEDFETARKFAHAIKGSAANMRIHAMQASALALELVLRSEDCTTQDCATPMTDLEHATAQLAKEIAVQDRENPGR